MWNELDIVNFDIFASNGRTICYLHVKVLKMSKLYKLIAFLDGFWQADQGLIIVVIVACKQKYSSAILRRE